MCYLLLGPPLQEDTIPDRIGDRLARSRPEVSLSIADVP
jgi:hypothetical protein